MVYTAQNSWKGSCAPRKRANAFHGCYVEAIRQLKFELLPHPQYIPALAPSDYHMFGPLKKPSMDEYLPVMMKLTLRLPD